ncbi:MAG TPA: glycoside hydrolase family 2 protein [Bacteroidia bacterium]|nr:glycoside hydrolase family 2 protein [Bacteroidia bacterium]
MPVRVLFLLILFASAYAPAFATYVPAPPPSTEYTVGLNTAWQFRELGTTAFFPAEVPGTVHTDLFRNGKIPDPYFGTNESKLQWVETKTWEYSTTFECSKKLRKEKHIELEFDGLDTYADVYLNDSLLFTAEDMFLSYTADIKKFVKANNRLRIVFHPASELIEQNRALSPVKKYPGGDRVFIRKAQYQFGWDWGPRFVTCGIWKPVRLVAWSDFRVTDVVYTLDYLSKDTAYMKVDFMFQSDRPGIYNFGVRENLVSLFSSKYKHAGKTNEHLQLEFKIPKPRLWWCNGLGTPEMYEFVLTARPQGRRGKDNYSRVKTKTGVRKIELSSDRIGNDGSFTFILNDVPVFAKGANWIPSDNFLPRVPREKIVRQLKDMHELNMNMVRVWGGGAYESDYFYEQCDSLGLMVWQDLMFACSMYPYKTLDRNNMLTHEINDNYRRLASHPCIALWCGDNENREGWFNWGWQKQMEYSVQDSTAIYNEYLEYQLKFMATLNRTDPFFPYLMSSPHNGWGRKEAYTRGDVHYWGVWWGMEPFSSYETHTGRFVSEFGFQGAPSFHTFKEMGAETSKWFADSTIQLHQKHPTGYQTIETYMKRDYGITPNSFEDYVYLSQVMQRDAMTTAIEAQRRNMPRCMGSLFWQYNDCWPATSWSVQDYSGRKKLAWYNLKRLYSDLMISFEVTPDSVLVWVVNNSLTEKSPILNVNWVSFQGATKYSYSHPYALPAHSSHCYFRIAKKQLFDSLSAENGVLTAKLISIGFSRTSVLATATQVLAQPMQLNLPEAEPKCTFVRYIKEGPMAITLTSPVYLRAVMITCDDPGTTFSDNGFDILPGESYLIEITTTKTEKEIKESLRFHTMNRLITDEKAEEKNELED